MKNTKLTEGGCCEDFKEGPCATMFTRYRGVALSMMLFGGLWLLVAGTGWVLGVIAFFRTI